MSHKVSVIIPYGLKHNQDEIDHWHRLIPKVAKRRRLFTKEFPDLYINHISASESVIDLTLSSLEEQTFDDFEVIIVCKYPEEVSEFAKKWNLDIKVVKDKKTIWHDIHGPALNNARNTGIIYADGELLYIIDPYQIFNENVIEDAWESFKEGYYITSPHIVRVHYGIDDEIKNNWEHFHGGRKKFYYIGDWCAKGDNMKRGDISMASTWGYGFTVSLEEAIMLNGFDEVYDGNYGCDDGEFGYRLALVSKYKRKHGSNILYELSYEKPLKTSWSKLPRDNRILLEHHTWSTPGRHVANKDKPSEKLLENYEDIYKRKWKHDINDKDNWYKFMLVPTFDIKKLRENRNEPYYERTRTL